MESSFDPGALLARSYALPRGPRVRLRLPHLRDARGISALFERKGLDPEEMQIARFLRVDPRSRLVICATALVGSAETVVGIGSISLNDPRLKPDTVVVDDELTDGLHELLEQALIGRASALLRTRAA